jgi:hypothetical protein
LLTQIYEVSTPGEARSISVIGVDHVGILVGNGEFPRELSVERAAEVAAEVLPPSRVSALFLTADLSAILKGAGELHPSIVHLGAAPELLSPGDVAVLKSKGGPWTRKCCRGDPNGPACRCRLEDEDRSNGLTPKGPRLGDTILRSGSGCEPVTPGRCSG